MSEPYKLAPELHETIYTEQIAARYLPKSRPQEQPCAIITGGQPGSGKSGLAALAAERFRESGYVLVDADKMRPFHPEYTKLMRADDKIAANVTHADCGPWATRLLRDGVAGRRNIIIDQTSRDPAAMAKMTQGLRQAGYRIELHVMAVSADVSEQRIHQRYEGQRARDGFGRFSTKDKHDEAFAGVADTLASVEAGMQVDRLCLYDRAVRPVYDNQVERGRWQQEPRARQVMDAERGRPMTPEETHQLAQGYGALVRQLDDLRRNATTAEKAAMQARHQQAVALDRSAREMGGIVKELQAKPLPGGLAAVVEQAGPQASRPYAGKVVALTAHHALQQTGANKFIVHERGKVGQDLQAGKTVIITYGHAGAAQPDKSRDKGITR